jgi:hypothetical protein
MERRTAEKVAAHEFNLSTRLFSASTVPSHRAQHSRTDLLVMPSEVTLNRLRVEMATFPRLVQPFIDFSRFRRFNDKPAQNAGSGRKQRHSGNLALAVQYQKPVIWFFRKL